MELSTLLPILAILACPIAMGLMMWVMNRNMSDHSMSGHTSHGSDADRLKTLREQRQRLEQEIAEVEKISALETKKQALIQRNAPDGAAEQ